VTAMAKTRIATETLRRFIELLEKSSGVTVDARSRNRPQRRRGIESTKNEDNSHSHLL
jgi:hypothetical protein